MAEKKTYRAVIVQPDRSLKVEEVEFPTVGDDEVFIKIEAAPINPSDVLYTQGRYLVVSNPPFAVGIEGSGTVVEAGKNQASRFKPGDRVVATAGGKSRTWAEYVLTDGTSVFPMHPDNTFEEAASHFVNPGTVLLMLRETQRGGHKAVVHSAGASALGKMLIRVFKEAGIKTINLVRRDDVKEELLALGADHVLNIKDEDFFDKLGEVAKKENATIFYDAIGGSFTVKALRKLPPGSRINVYGLLSGESDVPLTMGDLFSNKVLGSFFLPVHYSLLSSEEREKFAAEIQSKLKTTLSSKVIKTFPLEKAAEAIEHSEKFAYAGKTLLKP